MPRFVTERDFLFFQHINREVVVDVVDVEVILYKIIQDIANVNIYGESISKARYRGISLNALIKYPKTQPGSEGFGYDATQPGVEFRFVRKILEDVDVYPEVGDIIYYNETKKFHQLNLIPYIKIILYVLNIIIKLYYIKSPFHKISVIIIT